MDNLNTQPEPENREYYCEDCCCEISYYQYLEHTGSTDDQGYCEDCWQDFLENLFNNEEE